jgi:anti-sigma B factor antagonist
VVVQADAAQQRLGAVEHPPALEGGLIVARVHGGATSPRTVRRASSALTAGCQRRADGLTFSGFGPRRPAPFSSSSTDSPKEPPVKIKKRAKGDVTVLDLSGKIMGGDDFDLFNNAIKDLVSEGAVDIVLNLSKVKWINSTGLGLMVSAYTSLVKQGGRMKIAEVSDRIDNILHVTQLELIFETFENEDEAVASFDKD